MEGGVGAGERITDSILGTEPNMGPNVMTVRSRPEPKPRVGHLFFLKIYLFIYDRERSLPLYLGGERSRLHAGSPMWDSILGLQDHTLGQRQALNR